MGFDRTGEKVIKGKRHDAVPPGPSEKQKSVKVGPELALSSTMGRDVWVSFFLVGLKV